MRKRSVIILLLSLMMMVGVCSVANGAVTINRPTSNSVNSGTIDINISFSAVAPSVESITCNVTLTGDAIFNTSAVTIAASVANSSSNDTINFTYDTTRFRDQGTGSVGGITIGASCQNGTAQSATAVKFTIDNTAPTCTWSSPSTGSQVIATGQSWVTTTTNALTGFMHFDKNKYNAIVSASDKLTYSAIKGSPPERLYSTVTATVSDGYNTSTCTLSGITIDDVTGNVGKKAYILSNGTKVPASSGNNKTIIIALLAAVALYAYYNKK